LARVSPTAWSEPRPRNRTTLAPKPSPGPAHWPAPSRGRPDLRGKRTHSAAPGSATPG